jgi:hypothetical protein
MCVAEIIQWMGVGCNENKLTLGSHTAAEYIANSIAF